MTQSKRKLFCIVKLKAGQTSPGDFCDPVLHYNPSGGMKEGHWITGMLLPHVIYKVEKHLGANLCFSFLRLIEPLMTGLSFS